jgi:hypothetical protein
MNPQTRMSALPNIFLPRAGLSIVKPFRNVCGTKLKDQHMKKVLFVSLALAGMFVMSVVHATVITEDFFADPRSNGWQIFGNTNLFQWDSTNHDLAVTWDSSQANSYFYHPLGTVLTRDDDFSIEFDLQLSNATASGYGFELAIGLLNFYEATNADFSRGGGNSPNLFEFDYYPPDNYGDLFSIDATLKDTNSGYAGFYFAYDNKPLNPGVTYHITLTHTAGSPIINGNVLADGQPYTSLTNIYNGLPGDFRLDTLSISSYTDDGFGDSIFAQGTVDNFVVTLPPPPIQNLTGVLTNNVWQAQFLSRSNWLYTLERTTDFQSWTDVSPATSGNGTNLFLPDTNAPADKAFYRVKAERP